MAQDQSPLPEQWLLSDQRNDRTLELALKHLPPGSGFIFRHYHLPETARMNRFLGLKTIAEQLNHRIILSGRAALARKWGAEGIYGEIAKLEPADDLLRIASTHNGYEIDSANKAGVDAVMLSPVFPTRSHPDGSTLGPLGFSVLAQQARMPVIALGGMTHARAEKWDIRRWAAIDGLS